MTSTFFSICFTTRSISVCVVLVLIVNLCMPSIFEGYTFSESMFRLRRVKVFAMVLRSPTWFYEYTLIS